ncbi:type VI secretion system protein TssA [Thalassomonas haliotis]|uniref:Type VI secretion system protein TssA n=1 Tax=Thalassomonas haliotis TaxID=485448 RepID=A0ABY7VMK9_9GAMM|nr:type VI secretion system protein TssA [Thalassomonas haliotis]WDE14138.1 type VI secretion system protein TssA [Thalassomonas haliotis]
MDYFQVITAIISNDSPCGKSLEDDPGLEALYFQAEGQPERFDGTRTLPATPPDWAEIEKAAAGFLTQSKDLNLVVLLCQCALNRRGIDKFSECLTAVNNLVNDHWANLFPALDDGDATERLSALANLNHISKTITPLKNIQLASSGLFGPLCLRDLDAVELTNADSPDRLNESQIRAIFKDTDQALLARLFRQISACPEQLTTLAASFARQDPQKQEPNFDELIAVLVKTRQQLVKYAELSEANLSEVNLSEVSPGESDLGTAPPADPARQTKQQTSATAYSGKISCRADVEQAIDNICDYFQQHEPSSPVPLLLKRAKTLINKDFMQIMNDLAPNGADQVKALAGITEQD